MTVTLNSAGGSSVPNWQLVTSSAPSGVSTVTFSGLSGYAKYRVITANLTGTAGTAPTTTMTLNGDSSTNYSTHGSFWSGGVFSELASINTSSLPLGGGGGSPAVSLGATVDIEHALLACPKAIVVSSAQSSLNAYDYHAEYKTTSVLSSVTITSQTLTAGSVYLLGAN